MRLSVERLALFTAVSLHLDPWTDLGRLAYNLQVSKGCLIKYFKRTYSTTPRQYARTIRMGIAASRLLLTDMTPDQIATHGGYTRQNFCTGFKSYYGVPPGEYRSQQRWR